ncbi:glycosyltransferase family 2 protein [Pelomyxa schiedti]|nr:glycosyltransferase family 2 protein [Pelomyxa schiedti]
MKGHVCGAVSCFVVLAFAAAVVVEAADVVVGGCGDQDLDHGSDACVAATPDDQVQQHPTVAGPKETRWRGLIVATTMKPSKQGEHSYIIQRNAVNSWSRLRCVDQILIFGDDAGAPEIAESVGNIATVIKDVKRNSYGLPLMDSMLPRSDAIGLAKGSDKVVMFSNADMIYLDDVCDAIETALSESSKVAQESGFQANGKFMIVTRRWNTDIKTLLDFNGDWQAQLRQIVRSRGKLMPENQWAIDTFIWRAGLFDDFSVPPLIVGIPAWDNWLLHTAITKQEIVIDATEVMTAIHQNHPFGRQSAAHDQMTKENKELAKSWFMGNTARAPYSMSMCSRKPCIKRRTDAEIRKALN